MSFNQHFNILSKHSEYQVVERVFTSASLGGAHKAIFGVFEF